MSALPATRSPVPGVAAPPPAPGPTASPGGTPRPDRTPRVPLRVTLVALLVGLVTVALMATGLVATSLLNRYLLDQQDDQLRALAQAQEQEPARALQLCTNAAAQFYSSTYVACVDPGGSLTVLQGPRDRSKLPDPHTLDGTSTVRYTSEAVTLPAVGRTTSWRVVTGQLPGGYVIVVGTDLAEDRAVLGRLVTIEIVVGLLVLAVLGTAGYLLVRNSLRPLVEVEHTAQAIAAGNLSRRVPQGDERTEVGRLSTALNGMLARIESSFRAQQASEEQARASEEQALASEARMRRFVADASHELRTPLTSIRGFAELHRQGAAAGPEDTRRLMQRIESEATRMGLLVEDLLQLARLDQQRPLNLAPVDLAELAGDAVHDARAVQPERPITFHLDPSLTDVPVVIGDEARLRQVMGNLVTNALTHTPVTARVTVRLSEDPADLDTVVASVTDEGPGLPPADAQRVFERFYRADTSRTRAAGGSGLGLSIVASLVAAHGGRVDLTTAPGQGATFAVRLPRSGPGQPPAGPPG